LRALSEPIKQRAVFLDRDGVINRSVVINGKPFPPANLAAMEVIPGVPDAMNLLAKDFLLIVITNQPDVARGTTPQQTVEEINDYLASYLPIKEIRTCFHDNHEGCNCRKPSPGALLAAAEAHQIDLTQSYMIGDRWGDIEAGERAGCKTIFIDYGYAEKQPTTMHFRVQNLMEAAQIILGENK
jgi:D-glycero-D-manno-heptose 1,7-bisphosphate phosphatase